MIDKNIGYIIIEGAVLERDNSSKPNIIDEHHNRVMIETVLQDLDAVNRNRRYYSSSEMIPEINSSRIKELIANKQLKAESSHPLGGDLARQSTIYIPNTCANILKVWVEGKNIMGHVVGCQSQLGEDFNNGILAGEIPSWSLRALGVLKPNVKGYNEVKNVRIITWDNVSIAYN